MARKIIGWAGLVLLTLAFLWVSAHMFIEPVHPDQEAPGNHLDAACAICHVVTESAELVDVE